MFKTLSSFLKGLKWRRRPKIVSQTSSMCVYRDEIAKKPTLSRHGKVKQVKFDLKSEEQQQQREADEISNSAAGEGVIFKVLMSKEEAGRLLSRCGDGGVPGFKDVANELMDIPLNRITMVSSSSSSNYRGDGKLETICEDD